MVHLSSNFNCIHTMYITVSCINNTELLKDPRQEENVLPTTSTEAAPPSVVSTELAQTPTMTAEEVYRMIAPECEGGPSGMTISECETQQS